MPGRGRPRKAKGSDTNCRPEETKGPGLPADPEKVFSEEPQNGASKEQKPKKPKQTNKTAEKPPVQSSGKEEMMKQQKTDPDSKTAPVKGPNVKTCAAKAKTTKQAAGEMVKTQMEPATNTMEDSLKTTKGEKSGSKAKPAVEFTEEAESLPPQDTAKDSPKTAKRKKSGGKAKLETPTDPKMAPANKEKATPVKAKSPERFAEGAAKTDQKVKKEPPKARVAQDRGKDNVDVTLNKTLEKLKIRKNPRSDSAEVINNIIKEIRQHLKMNTECFKEVEEPLRTGSYYENLKISEPDEFDVMMPIPVDRVNIKPFRDNGAFYSVALKRDKSSLKKFQVNDTLSAYEMLKEFREEVKKSIKGFKEWKVDKKKKGSPAVTLTTTVKSVTISLDVVLSLVVKPSWPPYTTGGLMIDNWLGKKVKREYKRKPYYLVPKYEGCGTVEDDGVSARDTWRLSFSHIEKAILTNHGSEKTCCEASGARCCRKDCLKLLKHLLSLLKENDTTFDKFCSYHAKTTLLHACCSRTKDTEWRASDLGKCFEQLLDDFVGHLEKGTLCNFFIPTQNLLSGLGEKKRNSLARRIKEERDNGFPIFQ